MSAARTAATTTTTASPTQAPTANLTLTPRAAPSTTTRVTMATCLFPGTFSGGPRRLICTHTACKILAPIPGAALLPRRTEIAPARFARPTFTNGMCHARLQEEHKIVRPPTRTARATAVSLASRGARAVSRTTNNNGCYRFIESLINTAVRSRANRTCCCAASTR